MITRIVRMDIVFFKNDLKSSTNVQKYLDYPTKNFELSQFKFSDTIVLCQKIDGTLIIKLYYQMLL